MKAVIERIEYTWWNFHIKMMDESPIVRETLPILKEIWESRDDVMPYLVLSVLGFPLGVLLGWLSLIGK